MAMNFDELVEQLLHDVSHSGRKGFDIYDVEKAVRAFYDAKKAEQATSNRAGNTADGNETDLLFSEAPPATAVTVVVDQGMVDTAWEWLEQHPDIDVESVNDPTAAAKDALPQPSSHTGTDNAADVPAASEHVIASAPPKHLGKRIFPSEQKLWQVIAGHGPDRSRVPDKEFEILVVVAAYGATGVLQPEVTRITAQDKRSLPKRTDNLAKKGYITKEPVLGGGSLTSLLRLTKYAKDGTAAVATGSSAHEQPTDQAIGLPGPGRNDGKDKPKKEQQSKPAIIHYDTWYAETMRLLRKNGNVIAMEDLRIGLDIHGQHYERVQLSRCLHRLVDAGCLRQVKAKVENEQNKSSKEKYVNCVQLLREPTEEDRLKWRMGSLSSRKLSKMKVVEKKRGSSLEKKDEGGLTKAADRDGSEEEDDDDDIEDTTNEQRIVPQWTPDLPYTTFLHKIIDNAGVEGINSTDLTAMVLGKPFRRPISEMMIRLTDQWQTSQPQHLRHLGIIKDTEIQNKSTLFKYRTLPNFEKAVEAGQTSWEAVLGTQKQKKSQGRSKKTIELDEWGFPKLSPSLFADKEGWASLAEGSALARRHMKARNEEEGIVPGADGLAPLQWTPSFGYRKPGPPKRVDNPNGNSAQKGRDVTDTTAKRGKKRTSTDAEPAREPSSSSKKQRRTSAIEHGNNGEDGSDMLLNPTASGSGLERAGIYINPPGAMEMRFERHNRPGRKPAAMIAVFKSDKLKDLPWFTQESAPASLPREKRHSTDLIDSEDFDAVDNEPTYVPRPSKRRRAGADVDSPAIHNEGGSSEQNNKPASNLVSIPIPLLLPRSGAQISATVASPASFLPKRRPGRPSKAAAAERERLLARLETLNDDNDTDGEDAVPRSLIVKLPLPNAMRQAAAISDSNAQASVTASNLQRAVEEGPDHEHKRVVRLASPRTQLTSGIVDNGPDAANTPKVTEIVTSTENLIGPQASLHDQAELNNPYADTQSYDSGIQNRVAEQPNEQTTVQEAVVDESEDELPDRPNSHEGDDDDTAEPNEVAAGMGFSDPVDASSVLGSDDVEMASRAAIDPVELEDLPELLPVETEYPGERLYLKGGVTRTTGIVALRRKEIVMNIMKKVGGAFPGVRDMWYPFVIEWKKFKDQQPDRKTVEHVINTLIKQGELRKYKFSFVDRKGNTLERFIVAEPGIGPTSEQAKKVQRAMIESYPYRYMPPEIELAKNIRNKLFLTHGSREAKRKELKRRKMSDTHDEEYRIHRRSTESGLEVSADFPIIEGLTVKRTEEGAPVRAEEAARKKGVAARNGSGKWTKKRREEFEADVEVRKRQKRVTSRDGGVTSLQHMLPLHQLLMCPEQIFDETSGTFATKAFVDPMAWRLMPPHDLNDILQQTQILTPVPSNPENWPQDRFFDVVNRVGEWEIRLAKDGVSPGPRVGWTFINHGLNCEHVTWRSIAPSRELQPANDLLAMTPAAQLVDTQQPRQTRNTTVQPRIKRDAQGRPELRPAVPGYNNYASPYPRFAPAPRRKPYVYTSQKPSGIVAAANSRHDAPLMVLDDLTDKDWSPTTGDTPAQRRSPAKATAFSEPIRLAVAVALVKSLCAGVQSDVIKHWDLVAHALGFKYSADRLQNRWKTQANGSHGNDFSQRLQDALHEPFLKAYENGKLPKVDFENLQQTDWPALVEWAETEVLADMDKSVKVANLPESRHALEDLFNISLSTQPITAVEDSSKGSGTYKARVAAKQPFSIALSTESISNKANGNNESSHRSQLAKSWIRADVMTTKDYNPGQAGRKLAVLGQEVTLHATEELVDAGLIAKTKAWRQSGKRYHITANALSQFQRWPGQAQQEFHFLREVAAARTNLVQHFQTHDEYGFSPDISEAEMVVLTNMSVQGHLRSVVVLPERNDDFDAPFPKLTKWPYGGRTHDNKKIDPAAFTLPVVYKKTSAFTTEHPLMGGVPVPMHAPAFDGEINLRIPFWVDIHDRLLDNVWDMALQSVLHLLVFRPGLTVEVIEKVHKGFLWTWEIGMVLEWMEKVGVAQKVGGGQEGWRANEWFYCLYLPEVATWRSPGEGMAI